MAGKNTARLRPCNPQSCPRVNLILFQPQETARPLPLADPRAQHLVDVLQRRPGETFDAGLINGPRGKGTVVAITATEVQLRFVWGAEPPPLDPITLILGLPRPQTARKILREATALGVAALHFVLTDKGDAAYADSTLWHSGEWEKHLLSGAEQAFCTRLPVVTHGRTLAETIAALPASAGRIALDNYESPAPLSSVPVLPAADVIMALGPERGWAAADRALLRAGGFTFAHLGDRVLRVETATVAALAVLKARRGAM